MPIKRPKPTRRRPQGLCLDRGYDYDEVRALAEEFGFTCHIRSRGEERALKREAGFRARRWVVERTHSWLPFAGETQRATRRARATGTSCSILRVVGGDVCRVRRDDNLRRSVVHWRDILGTRPTACAHVIPLVRSSVGAR